ncbi:unnamed protein product [Mytilus coruscus]|uniref:Guanylate cyclase domain-containing protein n=1 Tax=Mytilus coruscus TaxID=42192 RepID=A0A6J8C6P6_MYTCO|nr:unnamed protein product [Mytilus coruscus]
MPGKRVPKIIRLIRQAKGLNADPDDDSLLDKLTPHVPGIVTFADHNRKLPWSTEYSTVLVFADVSGFTALCECYSAMQDSGIDKLTKTLNGYLGAIVENLLSSEGDVLKFAGDAILAVWRVNSETEMTPILEKVIACCLDIQKEYGEWQTDIGITLTVKMGISTGPMKVTFLGNNEFRVYVETGKAVSDVNVAESFCQSGYVVVSPDAWSLCKQEKYETEVLHDEKHIHILSEKILPATGTGKKHFRKVGHAAMFTSKLTFSSTEPTMSPVDTESNALVPPDLAPEPTPSKSSKLSKLRGIVKTVTDMKLDEALRLFILPPVLRKIDDFQPLEYLSEMRQVSIVFINLVLNKDENEGELLQKIFGAVYIQIKALHGCLNKVFLFDKGCTFLVIFGLPGFKHEQDCAHALMCSYRMKETLCDVTGVLHVSIGVTTGTTFCGVVGHSKRHEYSVIGRRVNFAARLMMHYPDKVACDDRTFQLSRLPAHNFDVLITKRMKGLRNVGIIREFKESAELGVSVNSIPYFQYPLLGCRKEVEMFEEQVKNLKNEDDGKKVRHLVYVGASGIGKTRLLDHLIVGAEHQDLRVISCAVQMNDRFNSNFLTRHIMRMLISSAGFSPHIDREPEIIEKVASKGLLGSFGLMPHVLGTQLSKVSMYIKPDEVMGNPDDLSKANELIGTIAELCIHKSTPVVIILDDAHNIDQESWTTLFYLSQLTHILLVLSIRPKAVDEPSCPAAANFFDSRNVYIEDIGGIESKYLTALACQLMEVVRIPNALERLLKERCHGVPYWCEQVLIDMVEKKQLMILETEEGSHIEESTIAPNANHIKRIQHRAEHPAAEFKQLNDIFITATSIESLMDSKEPTSANFLKDLGYIHKETEHKGISKQRIAVFSPHVNPVDIPIPDIMKNLITAKIDSMRATEQLIVKCASVLGETFPRDMIESILPNVNRIKARKSFKVLRKTGIFECANLHNPLYNKFSKDDEEYDIMECYCPRDDEHIDKSLCNLMKFTNLILMETCYKILMESQRKTLHASAANYLEKKADQIRKDIPYHMLERPPPKFNQEEKDRNHSRRRSSNRVEDIAIADAESYMRVRGRRKGIQIQDVSVLLPTLMKSIKSERTLDEACEGLMPIYSQIYHHRKATQNYMNIIDILVEEAAASIVMKQTSNAMMKLEDAEEVINEMIDKEKKDEEDEELYVLYAKLARLTGKALYVSGEKEDALLYTRHAAKLLKIAEPEGYCNTHARYYFLWIFLKFLRISTKPRKPSTDKTVEQGYCLSELYEFEKENNEEWKMSINSFRQMIKITGRFSNLHQMIRAYKVMIEFCGKYNHPKMKGKLEKEFLASCLARNEELQADDLVTMSEVCADICLTSLQKGDITRAISSGTAVVEIGDSMKQTDINRTVYPLMALTLLFTDKKTPCLDIMQKMKSYNKKKYSTVGQAWYHAINMEVMLSWNISQEPFDDSLDFATYLMSKADAVYNEMLPRYMLTMSIAMWYCRHDQWSSAQIWFDYWEVFDLGEINFLSVYVLARKIEIMLMSLSISKITKPKFLWKQLETAASEDLKKMSGAVKKVVTLKPRYHHLNAYLLALKQKYCWSEFTTIRALKLAKKQGNKLECGWIKHNRHHWFGRRAQIREDNRAAAEWYKLFSSSYQQGFCTWPLVAN